MGTDAEGHDQDDRLGGRNGRIWRDYTSGRTQEWIAERYGIAQSRVSQILAEVREALPADARTDWRLSALETLGTLHAEMLDLAGAQAPPAYSQKGEILRDENAQVVRDYAARMAAVDRVIRVQERAARLLGLDAATKSEQAVTVDATPEVTALLERSRAARGDGAR